MPSKKLTMTEICQRLYPLHRTLVSDETNVALSMLGTFLPSESRYTIERYAPNTPVWTWKVPGRYVVREAWIKRDGKIIVDFKDHPLHLVSYSIPVHKTLPFSELMQHIHTSVDRLNAIPWRFSYYEPTWGFCLRHSQFEQLLKVFPNAEYEVCIDSEVRTEQKEDGLGVGVATIAGRYPSNYEILICTNICHPYQVNDSITGVAVACELAHRLTKNPLPDGSKTIRFLFCPETIGSICYLAHHPEIIQNSAAGMCFEMLGTTGPLTLQFSKDAFTALNAIALKSWNFKDFFPFRSPKTALNDEIVLDGPGVDIPTISITRYPYPEYHTSDDTPDILYEEKLEEAANVIEKIVRIAATDYIPVRTFQGPIFLSGYGLWVDWRTNPSLNTTIEKVMLLLEGQYSIFDITRYTDLSYEEAYQFIEKLRMHKLITRKEVETYRRR